MLNGDNKNRMRKSALFPKDDKEIVGKNFMSNKLTINSF